MRLDSLINILQQLSGLGAHDKEINLNKPINDEMSRLVSDIYERSKKLEKVRVEELSTKEETNNSRLEALARWEHFA